MPIPEGIDIYHLKEEIEATDMSALQAVMSVDVERANLEAEAEELNDMLAAEGADNSEEAMDRLTQVYERLEQMDAATAETRASKILSGLGFTPEKQRKATKEFSGGWRMVGTFFLSLFFPYCKDTYILFLSPFIKKTKHLFIFNKSELPWRARCLFSRLFFCWTNPPIIWTWRR